MVQPPSADRRPSTRDLHGDRVIDEYAWMADRDAADFQDYLRAENDYAQEQTAHLGPLRERIVAEIKARTKETDLSVPVRYRGWWYYARTTQGHQYPADCRVPALPGAPPPAPRPGEPLPGEQVVVDGEVEAAGSSYFAVGGSEVSVDGELVAFAVDRAGDERFDVTVRRIADGAVLDQELSGVGYGLVWSLDGQRLYYTRVDEAWRPHQVWEHRIGAPVAQDRLILQEDDERFWLAITASRDDSTLVIAAGSKSTSECWLLDLGVQGAQPVSVAGRTEGLEYDVEVAGEGVFITHNGTARDFEVAWAPREDPVRARWVSWLPPVEGVRYLGVEAFASHVVLTLREGGLPRLKVARRTGAEPGPAAYGELVAIDTGEELTAIGTEANPEWDTRSVRLVHESFVTPRTVADYDVDSAALTVLKQQEVLGGYEPTHYVQRREWVRATDGTLVPLSLVHRVGVAPDGSAPVLLYGYGAYETPLDPWFSVLRLSLLDRGVVFAVGHVRGGGEMGRGWYEQGRLADKTTSFTDLVACARHLHDTGWCAPDRLALHGASAGGLLVGATLNLAPELFAVVHADVPFVDPLTTMLDESLPLTVAEWEEWGDPLHDPVAYGWLKSYAPYENLRPVAYPAILATTSLNDTRVYCTEPAKWVARLRTTVGGEHDVPPILLRTEMVAGHGGRSGRYDAWEQYAWESAFVLDRLGIRD